MFGDFSDIKIINRINQFARLTKKSFIKKKIILCVPNTLIYYFDKKILSKYISLGVQNCHQHQRYGPFTGSVNSSMLSKAGANYIILGHSENRAEGETNKLISQKITSSIKSKLNVIFCIGESLSEKRKKTTFSVLRKQIESLKINKKNIVKIIIAYEPVWSIGTNRTPKPVELSNTVQFIKKCLKKTFKLKKSLPVLYGGSVNSKNISLFSSISILDGFLIGGASQSSKEFIDIVKNYYK
jgi:triosephosphate isomerase